MSSSLSKVGFLRVGDMTDSLRVCWKLPELSDKLTMLVIVGTRSTQHSLISQVRIGSDAHCLLGELNKILESLDSEVGLKVEKTGVFSEKKVNVEMVVNMELLVRERRSLDILSVKWLKWR